MTRGYKRAEHRPHNSILSFAVVGICGARWTERKKRTKLPETFDIRTLQGLKFYRLRQAYDTSFGTLRELGNPRYVQFGLRIFF